MRSKFNPYNYYQHYLKNNLNLLIKYYIHLIINKYKIFTISKIFLLQSSELKKQKALKISYPISKRICLLN
jgi:hypothetical protein